MRLILPVSITFPRKTMADKKYALNLNVYRNLNFIVNNQMKAAFVGLVMEQVACNFVLTKVSAPYRFTYTLFQESKRKTDVSNVCCVVDKFCCDSLVSLGVIPDDNQTIIKEVVYRYGGVNKESPHVVLEIEGI